MYKYDLSNEELAKNIRLAVKGDEKAIYEIIATFHNLILKESRINGHFSPECKDYIEDKIIKDIKNFKNI